MLALVGVTAAALVITGLGTLLLVRRATRNEARQELLVSARNLVTQLRDVPLDRQAATITLVRKAANLEDGQEVVLGPSGTITRGQLPAGVSPGDLDTRTLLAAGSTSGVTQRGRLAFAAVVRDFPTESAGRRLRPNPVTDVAVAIVLTRKVGGADRGVPYFLLTAAIVLLMATVVADRLVRRITQPLRKAQEATRRIAAGDLATQLPVAPDAYPELSSLTSSINTMADSLNRSRHLERQFLMSVSHDLRTPLTSIRGFAEAISDGAATDVNRAAGVIAAEARRLERLVGDLLDLAKLDSRRFSLDLRAVEVGEVVSDTAEGFRPASVEAGLVMDVATDPDLVVTADPDRLAQVVANLVENAFKFASSRIQVRAAWAAPDPDPAAPRRVEVAVSDDGPGIPPADLSRIFERLYQSARTPARQAGSGLGLAIVSELVQAMGGQVRAESPASGTRMVVSLPAWSSRTEAGSSTSLSWAAQ